MQILRLLCSSFDCIKKNISLRIYGDGNQTRDFVAIEDVVDAIQKSIAKLEGNQGTIFNIGSGMSTTIKKVVELLIKFSGKSLSREYLKFKEGEIKHSYADITLAKKYLNFYPRVEFSEGIKHLFVKN